MIKYCCCCGRQISKTNISNDRQAPSPCKFMGTDSYACADCSKDLDENGLFPEECSQAQVQKTIISSGFSEPL
jgi:hypothetical protein